MASNTEWIESLEDFPEDIGAQIWREALRLDMLDIPGLKSCQTVFTFVEAYPNLMMSEILVNNLILVNDYQEELMMLLRKTKRLDLSHCGLDDQHELLGQICQMEDVEVVLLAHNNLTDVGGGC